MDASELAWPERPPKWQGHDRYGLDVLLILNHQCVCGILQARILEWDAMLSSRESSRLRDGTHVCCISCFGRQALYLWSHLGSPPCVTG